MVNRIIKYVKRDLRVCAVFYGHPGVFCTPSHESIRIARKLGYRATMLPAISAEDCLFADLGVDPGKHGCQSFEATDFLVYGLPVH
jgi:Tetrapyrrole (Corrin/Porphyrin) Methylases